MADVKWIKITTDIFDDEKILMIESMPAADSIIVIWFKLLTFAGKQNNDGVFLMSNRIAYTDEMLATIFRRDVNTLRLALNTFQQFGMIEIIDNVISIPNWNKHQTLDSYEKKKERDRLYQAERRAKQRALIAGTSLSISGLPQKEWNKVLQEFNFECAYCGSTDGLEQEHIVPVINGGRYEIGNIVPACRRCNASKKDKDMVNWYTRSDVFDAKRLQHIMKYAKSLDESLDESLDIAISDRDIEEDKEEDRDKEGEERKRNDYQQIVDLYNTLCPSYPKLRALSEARRKAIKARLRTYTVDDFRSVFEKAEASSFLKGGNERNWSASFDWMIKDSNFAKILDGNYDDKPVAVRPVHNPYQRQTKADELAGFYQMAKDWAES